MKCAVKVDLSVVWPHFLVFAAIGTGAVLLVFLKSIGTNGVTRLDDPFLC